MGLLVWLMFTTGVGFSIDHLWFLESPDWVGSLWGFGVGVIMWLLTLGGGSGIGDAFSGFDDLGSGHHGGDCGGGSGSCGSD